MQKVNRVTFVSENTPMGPNHDPVSFLNDGQVLDGYKYSMDFDETHTWLKIKGESLKGGKPHMQWIPFIQVKAADFIEVKLKAEVLETATGTLVKSDEVDAPKKAKRGT